MKSATLPLLFFIIFALTAMLSEGRIEGKGQRCFCQKKTEERVRPALVKTLEIFPPSASCAKTEIILTLKKGKTVCLNPDGNQGQKFLTEKKQKKKTKKQQGKKMMENKPQN